jgi:prenyltransferase/squalene oxidase-like repeat protein
LALLALEDQPGATRACERGLTWLRGHQRPDGGFGPQPAVDQSTWVTALVALLPPERIGGEQYRRAVHWLAGQTGEETSFVYRLRRRLFGLEVDAGFSGWPWFPGAASWVTPTSLAILALTKALRRRADAAIAGRVGAGRQYLLSHRCADGGWNHGSERALGYDGNSYPETTGLALVALAGTPRLEPSLSTAAHQLRDCRSAEGVSWLRLGLRAHGRATAQSMPAVKPRDVRDTALCVLAEKAEKGRNVFLD